MHKYVLAHTHTHTHTHTHMHCTRLYVNPMPIVVLLTKAFQCVLIILQALMPIGALLGGPIAGWLVEYFGRQLSLMLSSVPMVAGWIMILVTHEIDGPLFRPLLFSGRFFTGVGAGCLSVNVPVRIKILL